MRKIVIGAATVFLLTGLAVGVAGTASAAPARQQAHVAVVHRHKCWHLGWVSQGHESLNKFVHDFVSDIATTLKDTAVCKPGGWGRRLVAYLNKGNLNAAMPNGVMLWPRKTEYVDGGRPRHKTS